MYLKNVVQHEPVLGSVWIPVDVQMSFMHMEAIV